MSVPVILARATCGRVEAAEPTCSTEDDDPPGFRAEGRWLPRLGFPLYDGAGTLTAVDGE